MLKCCNLPLLPLTDCRKRSKIDFSIIRDVAQFGLERTVRDREAAGSNPVIPTTYFYSPMLYNLLVAPERFIFFISIFSQQKVILLIVQSAIVFLTSDLRYPTSIFSRGTLCHRGAYVKLLAEITSFCFRGMCLGADHIPYVYDFYDQDYIHLSR